MEPKNMTENINVTERVSGLWKVPFLVLFGVFVYMAWASEKPRPAEIIPPVVTEEESVAITLPIVWGDTGKRMVETGVIDKVKLEALYSGRGGIGETEKGLLSGNRDMPVVMTEANAGVLLNLLWGVGLANHNSVLGSGTISDPRYGSPGRFASTGGFSLAVGDPMNHFNQHSIVMLGSEMEERVARVAKNIYRPCCGNSTYFPDCNHGMAMLGLLELMASNGVEEEEMYRVALQVNRLWFPGNYETIDEFLRQSDLSLAEADPKMVLGKEFSSSAGFARIASLIKAPERAPLGGSCSA